MYHFIAQKFVNFLISFSIIKKNDNDIYVYGFELLISTAISILTIIVISLFTHKFTISILFIIGFITTRLSCGGYHANHYISCYLLTIINYLLFLTATFFIQELNIKYVQLIITILSLLIIFLFAPIEHKNNPLSDAEKKRYTVRSRIIAIIFFIISIVFIIANQYIILSFSLMVGMFSVSISVIVAKLENLVQRCTLNKK